MKDCSKVFREYKKAIDGKSQFLLELFIKETGLKPSECVVVVKQEENGERIWIEKKTDSDKTGELHDFPNVLED